MSTKKDNNKHSSIAIQMLPYLWPKGQSAMRARVVISMIALILSKIFLIAVPYIYGEAVDILELKQGQQAALLSVPIFLVIAYAVVKIASNGFQQLRDAIFARVGQQALRQLAVKIFRHVHDLSLRFHLSRRTGGLNRIIDRGTKGIDFLLRMMLFNLVPTILEIIMVSFIMFYTFGFFYGVVTSVTVAVYVIVTYILNDWRTKYRRQMNDFDNDAGQKAVDSLLNYETVKYFNNENHETKRYDKTMAGYEEASIKIYWSLGVLNFVQNVIISIGLMLLMCLAAYDVMQGEKRIGDFVMVNAFLLQLYMPLNFLGTVFREIKQSLIDMENMFNLLSEKQEVLNKIAAPDLNVTNAYIQFENVKFFYDADREIIKNLSFEVPAGSTLAIVGTSGAGKSTISRILYRFYDIQSGHVKIDGQDIREVSQETLRKVIGIVPQDTVLFNDTIGYNIRYGNMNATDEQVEEAAKFAQIDAFIKSLPQGMNTVVGERGLKLSGGEKQRIAIARTILKNPPILILDEATSALDTDTEKEIQSALNDIARNRTTLIIAHRLSTIVDADNILVLEKGEIIEQGNHTYLLSLNGRYASMWYKQKEAKAAQEKLKILKEV